MTQGSVQQSLGLRSERGPILGSVMLSMGLVALDATVLATAVPSIVADLGGFSQFPWLFSIYVLGQAVSVPIYGKLADQFGRKPVMLFGIAAFLLGSILCGVAWSMPALIVFRAVQGLGAGAIGPMSMTIVGDVYTVAERARIQGYLASVWAISAVLGPTLGGVFSDFLHWRGVFFINLPLGAIAGWVLSRRYHDRQQEKTKHKIDIAGAIVLTISTSLIILGLLEGGVLWPWKSVQSVLIFAVGLTGAVIFVLIERRAAEPILPGWAFTRRIFVGVYISSLAVGVLTLGLSSYVPMFVQEVIGTGALVAGFALAGLTIGWPIAASISGRIYLRIGFRNTGLVGGVFVLSGSAGLLVLGAGSSPLQVGITCGVIGFGLGFIASPTLVAAQSSVGWQQRGVITATNMFSRSMGSAIGTAVFGALANAALAGRGDLTQATHSGTSGVPTAMLDDAIGQVFLGSGAVAVIMVASIVLIPRHVAAAESDSGH